MLKAPSPFPFPGCTAFVAPYAETVRLIQRNADGTALVAFQRPASDRSASDTRTVPFADLHATPEAAIGRKPRTRGKAATARRRSAA